MLSNRPLQDKTTLQIELLRIIWVRCRRKLCTRSSMADMFILFYRLLKQPVMSETDRLRIIGQPRPEDGQPQGEVVSTSDLIASGFTPTSPDVELLKYRIQQLEEENQELKGRVNGYQILRMYSRHLRQTLILNELIINIIIIK